MNVAKAAIATTLVLVGLFSTAAEARISGDQIVPKADIILAQAVQSPNAVFNQCVRDNFVLEKPGQKPPMLKDFYGKISLAIAAGLVDDDVTFEIAAKGLLEQVCGDSQIAGGGDKAPAQQAPAETPTTDKGAGSPSATSFTPGHG